MAQATALQTYQSTTNREDLSDAITMISPEETPFFSRFGKTTARSVLHEWVEDSLAAPATNKHIQGEDITFVKRAMPSRKANYTQIFQTPVDVSDTQRAVNPAGYEDEFARQMFKAMKEHARDIEIALITGTSASGASGTASSLQGVITSITGVNITGTATGNETLTDTMVQDALKGAYDNGGNPDTMYVNSTQVMKVAALTTSATKFVETKDKQLTAHVEVYDTPYGRIRVFLHRWMPSDKIVFLEDDLWKVAQLRPTFREMAPEGLTDSTRGTVITELTLEYRAQQANAKITQLT